jgi:hypothetical protein
MLAIASDEICIIRVCRAVQFQVRKASLSAGLAVFGVVDAAWAIWSCEVIVFGLWEVSYFRSMVGAGRAYVVVV